MAARYQNLTANISSGIVEPIWRSP